MSVGRTESLSQRLTRQATWAIMALVMGFGLVTWVATGAHLVAISRSQAVHVAQSLLPAKSFAGLHHYRRFDDPRVWVVRPPHVWRSPNAVHMAPPRPALVTWTTNPPMVVVRLKGHGTTVTVGWPLAGDFDVLRDLLAVILIAGAASTIVVVWITSWATRRMLVPVDHMTRVVARMVAARRVAPLPTWSEADDEFNRLTQVFNELLGQLQQQAERERQMLAQAAHELRTPLQVLAGNLDLLSRWGGLDPAVREESLEQSRQVVERLSRLVQDLLMLERAQTAAEAVEPVDLAGVVETVADDARALAPDREIRLSTRPATVLASPWRVERALWAVVDNALAYTPADSPVGLTLLEGETEAGVEVRDYGPGIPPEELPHVFERFFRGSQGRRREGTGLGLPIARALVEHDGGRVHLESVWGRGTTVQLWWPRPT